MDPATTEIVSQALDLAKKPVDAACKLIESLLGEPCKVAGHMLADQVYAWQWRNRVRIANRAKEIMEENDIAPKILPAGFLLPLLEESGNVEDENLQEMWANLLASGVKTDSTRHPSFTMILRDMSCEDAQLLLEIGDFWKRVCGAGMAKLELWEEGGDVDLKRLMSLENLSRLGLVDGDDVPKAAYSIGYEGEERLREVRPVLTVRGCQFMAAITNQELMQFLPG